uniref:Putative arac family transcriptional regulator n=1 Tax=Anopheles triannulatus TaxID=58253 RepID=A0A2M4AVJ3_9DIPT
MDGDDRMRIDLEVASVQLNEDKLREAYSHQTEVIEKLYQEISKATHRVDDTMRQAEETESQIREKVERGLNLTAQAEQTLRIEQNLVEIGIWVTNMTQQLHRVLHTYLRIFTQDRLSIADLAELINPATLMTQHRRQAEQLPARTRLPTARTGELLPEVLNLVTITRKVTPGRMVKLTLRVPVVEDTWYNTMRGTVEPLVKEAIITTITPAEPDHASPRSSKPPTRYG